MLNIIRSDIFRILRSPAFYVSILIILVFTGLTTYTVQPGQVSVVTTESAEPGLMGNKLDNMPVDEMARLTISEYRGYMLESTNYKLDKAIMKKNFNMYYIFIFAAVLAITVDFSGGSVKNTLSSAISRKKYFASKVIMVMLTTLVMFFAYVYLNHFSNIIFNSKNLALSFGSLTKIAFMQLPVIIAITSILCGAAFVLKKTSLFNTIMITSGFMFPVILVAVGKLLSIKPEKILRFEADSMFARLASSPSDKYIITTYIACAVIAAVSLTVGWLSFRKSEVK